MENRIKELRENKGWSQEELADKVETSRSMIFYLEKGQRKLHTTWIEKFCNIFSVGPSELFKSEIDYKEALLSEKISRLAPEAIQKIDEYADLLLLQHSQRTQLQSNSQDPSDA